VGVDVVEEMPANDEFEGVVVWRGKTVEESASVAEEAE